MGRGCGKICSQGAVWRQAVGGLNIERVDKMVWYRSFLEGLLMGIVWGFEVDGGEIKDEVW